ncbi:MAG: hypothetical protein J5582_02655, partial [Ruminococcus sp.]|uniref:hypothetical protein n=1 Tax=Ruminococcus sp. TaxID=41978 RepID=UPI00345C1229|nr:hypothetical protein [Ruminococcus sp.]
CLNIPVVQGFFKSVYKIHSMSPLVELSSFICAVSNVSEQYLCTGSTIAVCLVVIQRDPLVIA